MSQSLMFLTQRRKNSVFELYIEYNEYEYMFGVYTFLSLKADYLCNYYKS